jgi:hypothetical protein
MDMEQHHVVKILSIKGLKLGEIARELLSAYGSCGYAPPNIKDWLHQIKFGRANLGTQHAGPRQPFDDIDTEILSLLRKYPLSLV